MKVFSKNETKEISRVEDFLGESIGERDIIPETMAEAVCSYNPNLEYEEVLKDIRRIYEGRNYFINAYEKLQKDRSVSFVQQLKQELPEDMSESERKGYAASLYTVLSEKEETPEEVAARAEMPLEKQEEILEECIRDRSDEIAAQFSEQLKESRFFREASETVSDEYDQEEAESELLRQEETSSLLEAAAVYTAAMSGAISEEWKNPDLLGITFAARDTFVRESILSGHLQDETEERDAFIREILKLIILTVLLAIAAVLLTKGLFAFTDIMVAEEALLTGAELVVHIVAEIAGELLLYFAAVASGEGALLIGIYLICETVSRAAEFFRSRRRKGIDTIGCEAVEDTSSIAAMEKDESEDDEQHAGLRAPAYA